MQQWAQGEYLVSTDRERLQLDVIHGFLSRSYWANGIPAEIVARSIKGSMCYGIYHDDRQIGFARVISDRATFAYVADVFVLEEHRSKGLARWLMRCILADPRLQGLRRWMLVTRDAHPIYENVGFRAVKEPGRFMELVSRAGYGTT